MFEIYNSYDQSRLQASTGILAADSLDVRCFLRLGCVALCTIWINAANGTDRVWSGGSSTDWGLNQNWAGNAKPSAGDNAVFNAAFTNQPNIGGNTSVGGIWMT